MIRNFIHPCIKGYELHFQRDHLDLVLQKIGLTKLDSKKERTAPKLKYFGYNLELMTAVDTLSVPASVLTSHHFQLTTPLLEDDGLSEYLLEAGFQGSRLGYIARHACIKFLIPPSGWEVYKGSWGRISSCEEEK